MPPESSRTFLFVYGTLKRGGRNHRHLADQTYVGEARTIAGYRLYHLDEYPGLLPAADDQSGVSGEVWSVTPVALARLDAFEGIAEGLYRREPISLQPPFADHPVETYVYNLGIEGRSEILNGTWLE